MAVCCHDSDFMGGTKWFLWIALQTSWLVFAHLPSHVSYKTTLKGKMNDRTHMVMAGSIMYRKLFFKSLWSNIEWLVSSSHCPNWQSHACPQAPAVAKAARAAAHPGSLWVLWGSWEEPGTILMTVQVWVSFWPRCCQVQLLVVFLWFLF